METCINYCEPGFAYMSSDERRWINRIRQLNEKHPDECIILRQPETNEGCIYAKFPIKWVRVSPPKQVVLTDEDRAKRREILLKSRRKTITEG